MLIWLPMMTDPPMLTLKEAQDGTYNIDDILQMNLLLKAKSEMMDN